ncbi:MAG: DUF4105 domain-containing protein [Bdellovibrionota bacterium]|nr:MAG: DUF4105 domain-containing protein [Bdellovibrionota bacterium]
MFRLFSAYLGSILLSVTGAAATVWAVAALCVDGPSASLVGDLSFGQLQGAAFALLSICLWWRTRSGLGSLALSMIVLGWWLSLQPRNDRNWLPDVARLAEAQFDGDAVTILNVRNFAYQSETESIERWDTRTYDLSTITGIDFILSYWGSPLIAHTIVSWEFADGRHLAISIETRKEAGEQYSALKGFFRQYELYFVIADERDVINLRTNHRGEDVYLYRLHVSPDEARRLLVEYLKEANSLAKHPRWYNAFSHNCTTGIRKIRFAVGQGRPWDWRIAVNGYIDQLGYERGMIDNSLPFPEIRQRRPYNGKGQSSHSRD